MQVKTLCNETLLMRLIEQERAAQSCIMLPAEEQRARFTAVIQTAQEIEQRSEDEIFWPHLTNLVSGILALMPEAEYYYVVAILALLGWKVEKDGEASGEPAEH